MNCETLIDIVKEYNSNQKDLNTIRRAYELASYLHQNQYRH